MNSILRAPNAKLVFVLKHFVFWTGLSVELFSQFVALPAVWYLVHNTYAAWDKLDVVLSQFPDPFLLLVPIAAYVLSCIRLVSVFGFLNSRPNLMRIYLASTACGYLLFAMLFSSYGVSLMDIKFELMPLLSWLLFVVHLIAAVFVCLWISRSLDRD